MPMSSLPKKKGGRKKAGGNEHGRAGSTGSIAGSNPVLATRGFVKI